MDGHKLKNKKKGSNVFFLGRKWLITKRFNILCQKRKCPTPSVYCHILIHFDTFSSIFMIFLSNLSFFYFLVFFLFLKKIMKIQFSSTPQPLTEIGVRISVATWGPTQVARETHKNSQIVAKKYFEVAKKVANY